MATPPGESTRTGAVSCGAGCGLPWTEMENQDDSALKVLRQQLETFEALRLQTLKTVSSVQSEINEILSSSEPECRSDRASPSNPSGSTSPRRELQTGRNVPDSPQGGAVGPLQTDVGSNITPVPSLKNSLSHAVTSSPRESFVSTLSFKMGGQEIKRASNENKSHRQEPLHCLADAGMYLENGGGPQNRHSPAASSTVGRYPLSQASPDRNQDLWSTLEKVSIASELMKEEMERSQRRELALALELEYLKQSMRPSSKGLSDDEMNHSPRGAFHHEGDLPNASGLPLNTDGKCERIAKLEKMVERLQNAQVSLEENNLNLRRPIRGGSEHQIPADSNCTHPHATQDTTHTGQGMADNRNLIPKASQMQTAQFCVSENGLETQREGPGSEAKGDRKETKVLVRESEMPVMMNSLQSDKSEKEAEDMSVLKGLEIVRPREPSEEQNLADADQVTRLEKEKQEIEKKFKTMEEYSKQCVKELKKLLRKYEDLKTRNRALDGQNKQLLSEKQMLISFLDAVKEEKQRAHDNTLSILKENDNIKDLLDKANQSFAQLRGEKQQLQGKVALLASEVSHLTEALGTSKLEIQRLEGKGTLLQLIQEVHEERPSADLALQDPDNVRRILQKEVGQLVSQKQATEKKLQDDIQTVQAERVLSSVSKECEVLSVVVAQLREDNHVLKQELEQSAHQSLLLEGTVKGLKEERTLLENCLFTVQSEKEILQLEVRKLHRDYLDLSSTVAVQLGNRSLDVSSSSLGLKDLSDAKDGDSIHDGPREKLQIDLIRKRFEEGELRREQRSKSTGGRCDLRLERGQADKDPSIT
uniref:Coiled-coil domain containing 110 n=1 Tax=Lepisosteus oculatus TaxID=7918 RepID=W5N8R2_LEPOC|nr:PREDICTED: coiled-coil domain-containing protein 110 isoform X1 [Lepisosteus oculatus]